MNERVIVSTRLAFDATIQYDFERFLPLLAEFAPFRNIFYEIIKNKF
jgi:hypothetical protein